MLHCRRNSLEMRAGTLRKKTARQFLNIWPTSSAANGPNRAASMQKIYAFPSTSKEPGSPWTPLG